MRGFYGKYQCVTDSDHCWRKRSRRFTKIRRVGLGIIGFLDKQS